MEMVSWEVLINNQIDFEEIEENMRDMNGRDIYNLDDDSFCEGKEHWTELSYYKYKRDSNLFDDYFWEKSEWELWLAGLAGLDKVRFE